MNKQTNPNITGCCCHGDQFTKSSDYKILMSSECSHKYPSIDCNILWFAICRRNPGDVTIDE